MLIWIHAFISRTMILMKNLIFIHLQRSSHLFSIFFFFSNFRCGHFLTTKSVAWKRSIAKKPVAIKANENVPWGRWRHSYTPFFDFFIFHFFFHRIARIIYSQSVYMCVCMCVMRNEVRMRYKTFNMNVIAVDFFRERSSHT